MPYNLHKSGKKFRSRNGLVRYGRGGRRRLPKASRGQFRDDIYGDPNLTSAAGNIDAAGYNVDAGLSHWESTGDLYGSFTAAGYDLGNQAGAPNASRNNTSAYASSGYNSGDRWKNKYIEEQRRKNQKHMNKKMLMNRRNNAKNRKIIQRSEGMAGISSRFHRV
jgi:hypothetical protein